MTKKENLTLKQIFILILLIILIYSIVNGVKIVSSIKPSGTRIITQIQKGETTFSAMKRAYSVMKYLPEKYGLQYRSTIEDFIRNNCYIEIPPNNEEYKKITDLEKEGGIYWKDAQIACVYELDEFIGELNKEWECMEFKGQIIDKTKCENFFASTLELCCEYLRGEGVEFGEVMYGEKKEIGIKVTFIEEGAFLYVGKNLFANIVPQEKAKHPTYIDLDKTGRIIIKADFTTNDNGGNYTFLNDTINVPPNSRVFFDYETGVEIEIPDGFDLTKFLGLFDYITKGYATEIEGNNIKLPNNIILNGKLNYKDGKAFIAPKEKIEINGIEITNGDFSKKVDVFSEEGIELDTDKKILNINSGDNDKIEIKFNKDNNILRVGSGDEYIIYPKANSEIMVEGSSSEIRHEGGFIAKINSRLFEFKEGDYLSTINVQLDNERSYLVSNFKETTIETTKKESKKRVNFDNYKTEKSKRLLEIILQKIGNRKRAIEEEWAQGALAGVRG